MKIKIAVSLLFLLILINGLLLADEDNGLSIFQNREIAKKSHTGNILLISGSIATVLSAAMIGSWSLGDDSIATYPDKNTQVMKKKSPGLAIFGGVLSGIGVALDIGGIITKVKARKMKKVFISNLPKTSFYIKPNGAELVFRF